MLLPNFTGTALKELCHTLPKLGEGCDRRVFDLGNEQVIKWTPYNHANLREAQVWEAVRQTEWADLFAPVRAVADSGEWLIMDKVGQRPAGGGLSECDVPFRAAWSRVRHASPGGFRSCDLHEGNWGSLDGKAVVCDYASFYGD